ncbi:MAG TPA: serine/threonine-protein kinase, partial [Planctomycetota bacterium]|nr:serine/threonine-protein kinase [Planctomycetota bacterium]
MSQETPRAWLLPVLFAAANLAAASGAVPEAIVASPPSSTAGPDPSVASPHERAGAERRIGPYRLIGQLGRGGMGEVWLAEQTEPFHRRVALKVLRADRTDDRALAAFGAEVEAMARVEHEHVARLLDAGDAPEPWLAMEFVPGEAATDYCERQQLPRAARLDLFLAIADAVHHLHGRGIRHGDLKPENILVLERGGRAVPKIVDFGLSTLAGRGGDEEFVNGTPAYMAPEQFTMRAAAVDHRADVFALGVVLHELLTGERPPGAAAAGADGCVHVTLDRPHAATARVHASLKGGLARVVGRALAADRDRRYGSVGEFTRALRR